MGKVNDAAGAAIVRFLSNPRAETTAVKTGGTTLLVPAKLGSVTQAQRLQDSILGRPAGTSGGPSSTGLTPSIDTKLPLRPALPTGYTPQVPSDGTTASTPRPGS